MLHLHKPLIRVGQRAVVGNALQLQFLANLIRRQQSLFHVPITQFQVVHQQDTSHQLRLSKLVRALGVRVRRKGFLRQPIRQPRYPNILAFFVLALMALDYHSSIMFSTE